MTTPARIEANRRNALKSTGPRTPHGKAIAGRNALRHGFRSRHAILPGEDPAEFHEFLDRLCAEFSPSSPTEDILLEQIAVSYWKLSRLQRTENQVYLIRSEKNTLMDTLREVLSPDAAPEHEPEPEPPAAFDETLGRAWLRDANSSRVLPALANYEARLERSLFSALRELTKRTHSSP